MGAADTVLGLLNNEGFLSTLGLVVSFLAAKLFGRDLFGSLLANLTLGSRSNLSADLEILAKLPKDDLVGRRRVQERVERAVLRIYAPEEAKAQKQARRQARRELRKEDRVAARAEKKARKRDGTYEKQPLQVGRAVWLAVRLVLALAFFGFWAGATWYLNRDGFSWWTLLTGYLALLGIGMTMMAAGFTPGRALDDALGLGRPAQEPAEAAPASLRRTKKNA